MSKDAPSRYVSLISLLALTMVMAACDDPNFKIITTTKICL